MKLREGLILLMSMIFVLLTSLTHSINAQSSKEKPTAWIHFGPGIISSAKTFRYHELGWGHGSWIVGQKDPGFQSIKNWIYATYFSSRVINLAIPFPPHRKPYWAYSISVYNSNTDSDQNLLVRLPVDGDLIDTKQWGSIERIFKAGHFKPGFEKDR